jgi:hypothetical protein
VNFYSEKAIQVSLNGFHFMAEIPRKPLTPSAINVTFQNEEYVLFSKDIPDSFL